MRILWLSDSPTCPTGIGTASRQVLKRLRARGDYEILCRGYGYHGQPYSREEYPYDIRAAVPDGSDAAEMDRVLEQFRPDVVLTFGDPWMFDWLAGLPAMAPVRWVGYYPLDSGPLMRCCLPVLERTDDVVTPSRYGRDLVAAAMPEKPVDVIYHGVDTRLFCPTRDRGAENTRGVREFVVGFVGRNQPRKQIPVLIKAFARFCRNKPGAFLYLHTAAYDCGWDLPELIERYGIREQCVVSDRANALCGVSDEEMNEIYNSMDVFVLPSTGEGFGLPTLEAMSAGVPVVVTDSSASRELASGRGELIRVAAWETSPNGNREIAHPDENHLVEILEKLYRRPELGRRYGELGRQFAEGLDWDTLTPQWEALLGRGPGSSVPVIERVRYGSDPAAEITDELNAA